LAKLVIVKEAWMLFFTNFVVFHSLLINWTQNRTAPFTAILGYQ